MCQVRCAMATTTRGSKQKKTESFPVGTMDPSTDINMASLVSLLEEHRQALSAEFKTSISKLEDKLEHIQCKVSDNEAKIISLEANANETEDRMLALEDSCAKLSESNAKLQTRVSELESRSRRSNIRILGLPESIEGPRPTAFFSELLLEVFGESVLGAAPECDRAHRTAKAKPAPGQRPRPVIICLHRHQVKETIIREARAQRGKLKYRDHPITIYEDYTPEVMEERHKYKEVMSRLYVLGLKPSLRYPARLSIITTGGTRKTFLNKTEAENYVMSLDAS